MDWSQVTASELASAVAEVEMPTPRPLPEFFAKFAPPPSASKLKSRVKCNVYYYRSNYAVMILLTSLFGFYRNPGALFSFLVTTFSALLCNDPFANAVHTRALTLARKVHPPLAAWMRSGTANAAAGMHATGFHTAPRSRGGGVRVCGFPRNMVVAALLVLSALVIYLTSAVTTICFYLTVGFAIVFAHASLRMPNLKARLASARDDFKNVWRGFDHTL